MNLRVGALFIALCSALFFLVDPVKADDEVVDLDVLSSTAPVTKSESSRLPNFKFYFDLWLLSQPGISDLSFANIHSYVFIDALPNKDLTFSFDASSARGGPSYFELDYQATSRIQLRMGKLWIPFDDLSPHNLFGGRTNVSALNGSAPAFLPDLWTELGVGAKILLLDVGNFNLNGWVYLTNGFTSGGRDPIQEGASYPNFADTSLLSRDNNRDKAFGGRLSGWFYRKLGLGASYYTARWSDENAASYRLKVVGFDSQYRPWEGSELRAGLVVMNVDAPSGSFRRGGWYGEIGQKFGTNREWKGLLRGGYRQLDDRVLSAYDEEIFGATLLYKPGVVQWSLEYSRDVNNSVPKPNYSLAAIRALIEL